MCYYTQTSHSSPPVRGSISLRLRKLHRGGFKRDDGEQLEIQHLDNHLGLICAGLAQSPADWNTVRNTMAEVFD